MSDLFRAYVPTKNKKCTMQFKGVPSSDLMTYDEVKDLQEYAGILADDVILIDIDDKTVCRCTWKLIRFCFVLV